MLRMMQMPTPDETPQDTPRETHATMRMDTAWIGEEGGGRQDGKGGGTSHQIFKHMRLPSPPETPIDTPRHNSSTDTDRPMQDKLYPGADSVGGGGKDVGVFLEEGARQGSILKIPHQRIQAGNQFTGKFHRQMEEGGEEEEDESSDSEDEKFASSQNGIRARSVR